MGAQGITREFREIPLIGMPFENVEDAQVDQWAATMVDVLPVIVEGKLQIMKRPGLEEHIDLGTNLPVDGLYWFDKRRVALAVSAGRVWKITDSSGTRQELLGSTDILQSAIVSFADDGSRAAMANGGKIVHTDLTTLTTMASANAPQHVTHLAEIDGYLLANDVGTQHVHFSDPTDFTIWNALDFFSAESRSDDVVAMKEAYRELIVLGRETVEFFQNDGRTPFARITGSAQPFGIEAMDSLANVGGVWMWLGDKRQLLTMNGRAVVPVSSPYDKLLQDFQSVDDAIGYTVSIGGHPIYLLNFPTAKQTLAYNYVTKIWHKWGYWDSENATYQRYRGNTYCYARSWNQHLVGDYSNGKIYKASRTIYTDDGNPIRSLLRSGHVTHGTYGTKRSPLVRLRCKRGLGNDACPNPQVMMRRRLDNGAVWTNERWKSLGRSGQHESFADWRLNGIYKSCQYEFIHSDPTDFVVMGAQEDVEYLGR